MLRIFRGRWCRKARHILPALVVFAVAFSAKAEEAASQVMTPMAQQLATLGGAMHVMAEFCGGYSDSELAEMREHQRQQAAGMGFNNEAFDQAFEAGKARSTARLDSATSEQRQAICQELKTQLEVMGHYQ